MERPMPVPVTGANIGRAVKSGAVLLQIEGYPMFAFSVQSAKEVIEAFQKEIDIIEGRRPETFTCDTS